MAPLDLLIATALILVCISAIFVRSHLYWSPVQARELQLVRQWECNLWAFTLDKLFDILWYSLELPVYHSFVDRD